MTPERALAWLALGLAGVVPPGRLFAGFGHPALVTIVSLFVVSRGITESGLLLGSGRHPERRLIGLRRQVLGLCLVTAALSAFMNNVGALGLVLAKKGLRQVGLDRVTVTGYLKGGMTAWIQGGRAAAHISAITAPELKRGHGQGKLKIIHTRLYKEHAVSHIEGSVHIPAPALRRAHPALDPGRPTAVICKTGNRSVLAASILKQRGFAAVANVVVGMTAWEAAGYPLIVPPEEGDERE